MQRFDCLAINAPLFGAHFLEASAGTGKTFAIEHVVARLILNGVDLEQILVVTFTRAAARELKLRIRANLERIVEGANWAYLPSNGDLKLIREALVSFDRCQIFTIHGFCSRMMKEFAFEAGLNLGLNESKDPAIDTALRDFFEFTLTEALVSPGQLTRLLRWAGSVEELARKLKKGELPQISKTFSERKEEFCRVLNQARYESLQSGFEAIRGNYKKMDGDFDRQLEALCCGDFEALLSEKESIFDFTAPENKKVRIKEAPSPPFFDWGRTFLLPLIKEAQDPKETLNTILASWKPIQERVLLDSGSFSSDDLLKTMASSIKIDRFKRKIQVKYRAVLIDEFQDTDPIQWEIFETLFIHHEALYLIGDPKQSIYRFRKADLYTYLKAKDAIAPEGHFHLDTNFRSSKPLIDALNGLFDRQWLYLPKQGRSLPYLPVKAGLDLISDFSDGKGSLHCFKINPDEVYRYVAREIVRLEKPPSSFAVLVGNRYQAAEMQRVLTEVNIPSMARSQEPLIDGLPFDAMKELFQALESPRHLGRAKAVLAGPFGGFTQEELLAVDASPFQELKQILEEKGLSILCQKFLQMELGRRTVQENIISQGTQFYSEWTQLLELLFEWERSSGFSFKGVNRFFEQLEKLDPEDAICRRKEIDEDAVQIMTMHVSKGLEFDIVFALGVGSRTPECDEEAESEKLRQLYVAMTRAKRRLYVPIPVETREAKEGTYSPIELFCRSLSSQGHWEEELQRLSTCTNLTIESVVDKVELALSSLPIKIALPAPNLKIPSYQPSYLRSFTSIAPEASIEVLEPMQEPNGVYTSQNLPRGAETGVMIHRIFERVFSETASLETIVDQEIGSLFPWKSAVIQMIHANLDLKLPGGFCLRDLDRTKIRVETEFLYQDRANYLKGFIDLLFVYDEKLYFIDWKTNWLPDYSLEKIEAAIRSHSYDLQASIYIEAMKRNWPGEIGGAIYIFVRGPTWYQL